MKVLVVNADDFGYSSGINRGIIQAHEKGIVTSTSVMVDGPAAEEARNLAKYQKLSVGLHFNITDENVKRRLLQRLIMSQFHWIIRNQARLKLQN